MKQKEIYFTVPKFTFNKDYLEAGCPVRYFEFNKHEYYALIATHRTEVHVSNRAKSHRDLVFDIYFAEVGGESVDKVKCEGEPNEISKSEALLKFLLAPDNKYSTVEELLNSFDEVKNHSLLIDGSLV